jgi:hypothetical protein
VSQQLAPPPNYLVEREIRSGKVTDTITKSFRQWLLALTTWIQACARVLKVVTLTNQVASIGSTPFEIATLSAGLYRLTYYARITTAASVSSSLTVSFGWTETTVTLAGSGSAITGNTTTTIASGSLVVRADASTTLTYSTTYASVGTAMAYRLDVIVEQVA